ncbi:glutathione S-transferase family protein [Phyllobacterium endophyticum]|uniref:Glutathione S-transferase n=1 Tax=Phyllobacterium endophyticum TaxID=1149773 RepID=A0A2P7AUU5_9HYPH|nr:glutathione S-transferase family protein [Phyllobacterium endophyticum]MBB3234493.1 glutathione S-transferase [Phyllobacterium endophyticum]PSH57988.1 glutathione S-transferase [Phyllobacterium endophyticum]TYR38656.1 glutathione S-transferase family protein [Phyllobacterium endophyticum]
MLTIYGVYKSRASRNYWMVRELGIDFKGIPVIQARLLDDPHASDAKFNSLSPAFLRVNPNGQIPTVDDDGLVLWESIAINLYLARKHRGSISAQNLQEEGLIEMWSFWAVNEIEQHAIKIVYVHDAGEQDTRAGKETLASASRMLERPFQILNQHLSDQHYLVGNRFTVADLNVAEILRYAITEDVLTRSNSNVVAWYERCHERSAFQDMWRARALLG